MTAPRVCTNCGRQLAGEDHGPKPLCPSCRHRILARAGKWAHAGGILAGLITLFGMATVFPHYSRFLVGWLAIAGIAYFAAWKVSRRVAFEVVRSRGVPPDPRG